MGYADYLRHLKQDIPASMVVFLVALPLCLGIALASNAPLLSGVIAGIIGGLVVSWISGSHVSVSGPAAGLVVIVVDAILKLGSFELFLTAVLIAGVLQFVLGALKAGTVSAFLPSSVVNGMLAAIGLIIIFNQIPIALGMLDEHYTHDEGVDFVQEYTTLQGLTKLFVNVAWGPFCVTLASLAVLMLWDTGRIKNNRLLSLVPGGILAVLAGVALSLLLPQWLPFFTFQKEHFVSLPLLENPQDIIGHLRFPDLAGVFNPSVWMVGLAIAIVASVESLLSLEAVSKLDPLKRVVSSNRELMAQGAGNLCSGVLGGLPITAVIVRSATNVMAGARTKMSAFLHGLWLLLALLFASHYINTIPLACLAAILLHVGYKLTKPTLYKLAYHKGWDHFVPFLVTIVAILATDLLIGILIGALIGILFVVHADYRSAISFIADGNQYLLRFNKDIVSFINKPKLHECLADIAPNSKVIIDVKRVSFMDPDIKEVLEDFQKSAEANHIALTWQGRERLYSIDNGERDETDREVATAK